VVYEFIRKGGKLPVYARWIEGEPARTLSAEVEVHPLQTVLDNLSPWRSEKNSAPGAGSGAR
jgi:hypothetical protein